jgi:hypothetical protein
MSTVAYSLVCSGNVTENSISDSLRSTVRVLQYLVQKELYTYLHGVVITFHQYIAILYNYYNCRRRK